MMRHSVLLLTLFIGSLAFGGGNINTDLNTTTASNITNTSGGFAVYFSNISAADGAGNWIDNGGTGSCNASLNPRCKKATDPLTIQVSDSVAPSGSATFYIVAGTGTGAPTAGQAISTFNPLGSAGYSSANAWTSISVQTFSKICSVFSASIGANCNMTGTSPVSMTLYLVADANGNGTLDSNETVMGFTFIVQSSIPQNSLISSQAGLYSWEAFPGDGEVVIKNPLNTIAGFQSARFYYVTGPDVYHAFDATTFNQISGAGAGQTVNTGVKFIDVLLAPDGTFQSYTLPNLSNGTSYYFRAALVDPAGNIGYLTEDVDDNPPDPDPAPLKMHAAKPDSIAGILSKNGNCFIATVAYGSPMAKEVDILRRFRGEVLMKTEAGKRFVHWYYHNGPYFSEKIRNHETAKAFVRVGLYPVVGFSQLALNIGPNNACLLIVTLLLLPLLIFSFWRTRRGAQ